MRIGGMLIWLPALAVGLYFVQLGNWAGGEDNFGGDGTCQGLAAMLCYMLSVPFFIAWVVAMVPRGPIRK